MSRAFVNEDAGGPPPPQYGLPDADSPYYDEAAAWALLEGADQGDTRSAEVATGCRWGEPRLIPISAPSSSGLPGEGRTG